MECKIEVNGSELFYVDSPGEKGTIVGVHGLTGNHKQLHYYAELLKGEYRFISVDLKGRGRSAVASEDTGIEQHTKDILELLDVLEIENPILMGYSMGAFIMGNVASKREDVKGLILLDGAVRATEHQRALIEPSLGRLSKQFATAEAYLEEIQGIYGRIGVQWTAHLESIGRYEIQQVGNHWEAISDEQKIRQDLDSFYTYDPQAVFEKVLCPILLVHSVGGIGANAALFLAEHYIETLVFAKAIEKVTSDSNHYTLVFENRDDVNRAIQHFLKKI